MKNNLIKISVFSFLLSAIFITNACRQTSNSEQKTTPTPMTNSTPETTRGCPAGTKPCGDACIPKKQNCGGN